VGAKIRKRTDLAMPVWQIDVEWQGKRVRRNHGGNERAAQIEAQRILKRLQEGLPVDGRTGSSTIRTYGQAWLAKLDNRTAADDRRTFKIHIEPRLGTKRLEQLDSLDVRAWIATMASEPLEATGRPPNARTVRNAHSVLSRMLSDAVADRLIDLNPATAERIGKKALPRPGRNRMSPGPRDHLAQLLEADKEVPLDRRVLYALQYLTGMRQIDVPATRR